MNRNPFRIISGISKPMDISFRKNSNLPLSLFMETVIFVKSVNIDIS